MMNMNNSTLIALLKNLITGIQKNQPKGSFLLGGTKYTAPQVVDALQSVVDALLATEAARSSLKDALVASDALVVKYGDLVLNLKHLLQVQAGSSSSTLAEYGLTPRKPHGTTSPKVKVAAADKALATRTARHTMGSKQKSQITGATAAAAAAEAPAPTGSTGNTPSTAPTSAAPVVTPGH
jgi:hypothetical protein